MRGSSGYDECKQQTGSRCEAGKKAAKRRGHRGEDESAEEVRDFQKVEQHCHSGIHTDSERADHKLVLSPVEPQTTSSVIQPRAKTGWDATSATSRINGISVFPAAVSVRIRLAALLLFSEKGIVASTALSRVASVRKQIEANAARAGIAVRWMNTVA